jgi:NADPH-dependent 2,4-dienoyl-CoA reductase/sulfur reductase-like enzyme
MADRIIKDGQADLVAMGRAQLADPDMVEKARRGEIAEIRPCIAECLGCIEGIFKHGEASCAVNPRVGREYLIKDIEGEKRATAMKVLVAGAGCAGLETARRAAFAGHKVILCETRGWIGGQLRLAARMPKREEIGDILPWYERQLSRLGVEIRLNTSVDQGLLDQISPDVLVIATGSLPEVPLGFIEGLDNIKDIELLMVDELLEEERLTGDNILVIGGDQIGLQVADYLSESGRKVYVVEKGAHFAEKMASSDRHYLMGRIISKGVKRHKMVQRIEIVPVDEVWMVNGSGIGRLPEINTIVLAGDRRPNIFLAEIAERKGIGTHVVGDAKGFAGPNQGTILAAIAGGYEVGRQV